MDEQERMDDMKRRLRDAQQKVHDDHEPWPTHPDVGPAVGGFVPYMTMFKHCAPPCPEGSVACVNCGRIYPYSDILEGELEEDNCPHCGMWAQNYYKNKPHRKVPING